MKSALRILSLVATLCLCAGIASAQTADPDATKGAKEVLNYIRHLSEGKDRHVLSGQFLDFEPNATLAIPEAIHAASGKWPAFIGVDYINFKERRISSDVADKVALEYWKLGGLVQIETHLTNPENTKDIGLNDKGVRLPDILKSGTPANIAWLKELDDVAAGLGRLQDEGVVVMWRPFHEMNGGWFWWGAKPPAEFKALWKQMFTYFTEVKHLHNLIWIYGPNMGPDTAAYYPGDGFVDLVGVDAYTDFVDAKHILGFDALLKTDKPIGFSEYGPHGASNPPGDFDFTRFADGLAANFPQASFFMVWNAKWTPSANLKAKEFYNDPSIVTRDDLPPGLGR